MLTFGVDQSIKVKLVYLALSPNLDGMHGAHSRCVRLKAAVAVHFVLLKRPPWLLARVEGLQPSPD